MYEVFEKCEGFIFIFFVPFKFTFILILRFFYPLEMVMILVKNTNYT